MVVDFAVEDDGRRPVLVEHRLLAAAQVDDTKPPMAQPHLALDETARVVGPAMGESVGHPLDRHPIHRVGLDEIYDPADSTHSSLVSRSGPDIFASPSPPEEPARSR